MRKNNFLEPEKLLFAKPGLSLSFTRAVSQLKICSPPWIRAPQILIQWILIQYSSCIYYYIILYFIKLYYIVYITLYIICIIYIYIYYITFSLCSQTMLNHHFSQSQLSRATCPDVASPGCPSFNGPFSTKRLRPEQHA